MIRDQLFAKKKSEIDSELLADALRQLDHENRQIVVAKIWGNLGFEEIASETGCSSSTACRRYKAALKQMRDFLGVSAIETLIEKQT